MKEGCVMQVAYIVRDLDAAMKRHWEVCGMGPWDIYEFKAPKVRDYIYRGKPATHTCLIAVTWNDHIQLYGALDNAFNAPPPNIPTIGGGGYSCIIYDCIGRAYRVGVRFEN